MNVLHVHTVDKAYGGAKLARTLSEGLNERQDVSSYLCVGQKKSNSENVIEFGISDLEEKFNLGIEYVLSMEGLSGPSSFKLNNIIKEKDINLLNFHNLHGRYFNILNILRIPESVSIVWTLHDMWPLTGNCTFAMGCERFKENCGSCPQLDSSRRLMFDTTEYLLKIKDYVTNRRDITVIGSCEWMTRKIKESHLSNSDIYTIYNGIDVGKYTPNQSADLNVEIPNTSDLKLLFVSSDFNNRRKGLDLLLDSLEKVNNKYQISLIAVGNGHIPEQRVPENVKIHTLGYINPDHMPTVYNIADVCVLTSRGETFNLTSLEAMACQTPVVAFDTGGLREQITKQTGWIIEKENINQFSVQIECIIKNKEDIHTISKNARKRIVANFSLELMIDNYINRYREILNS